MANQKATLLFRGSRPNNKSRGLRLTLVDTDAAASTFTDIGAATTWITDDQYALVGIQASGTTAPATATSFQFNINGNDVQKFIDGAATFDPKSTMEQKLGACLGATFPQGMSVRIIGRA